ncbi:hypothetical protein NX059_010276 [Plenodomus lindquistii]|nr:hypothetical protein NX059_010276 [Plenodomus lindquistii]
MSQSPQPDQEFTYSDALESGLLIETEVQGRTYSYARRSLHSAQEYRFINEIPPYTEEEILSDLERWPAEVLETQLIFRGRKAYSNDTLEDLQAKLFKCKTTRAAHPSDHRWTLSRGWEAHFISPSDEIKTEVVSPCVGIKAEIDSPCAEIKAESVLSNSVKRRTSLMEHASEPERNKRRLDAINIIRGRTCDADLSDNHDEDLGDSTDPQ